MQAGRKFYELLRDNFRLDVDDMYEDMVRDQIRQREESRFSYLKHMEEIETRRSSDSDSISSDASSIPSIYRIPQENTFQRQISNDLSTYSNTEELKRINRQQTDQIIIRPEDFKKFDEFLDTYSKFKELGMCIAPNIPPDNYNLNKSKRSLKPPRNVSPSSTDSSDREVSRKNIDSKFKRKTSKFMSGTEMQPAAYGWSNLKVKRNYKDETNATPHRKFPTALPLSPIGSINNDSQIEFSYPSCSSQLESSFSSSSSKERYDTPQSSSEIGFCISASTPPVGFTNPLPKSSEICFSKSTTATPVGVGWKYKTHQLSSSELTKYKKSSIIVEDLDRIELDYDSESGETEKKTQVFSKIKSKLLSVFRKNN